MADPSVGSLKNIAMLLGGALLFLTCVCGIGIAGKNGQDGRASAVSVGTNSRGVSSPPSTPSTSNPQASVAAVTVTVDRNKPSGEAWDGADGLPDLALCVESATNIRCYPDGTMWSRIQAPLCQDARSCTFRSVELPRGVYSLRVVDVDLVNNDPVGLGGCAIGQVCTIGQARVQVQDEALVAAAERQQRDAEEARFHAMTPAEHIATARAAMAQGCARSGTPAPNVDEAFRHLGALSRRDQRTPEGRALSDEIARCVAVREAPQMRRTTAALVGSRLAAGGLEVRGAIAVGPNNTTLKIISPDCDREMARQIANSRRQSLRSAGFLLLECDRPTGLLSSDTFAEPL